MAVNYNGRCSRCRQPASIVVQDASRTNLYVNCKRCSLLVVLNREEEPPRDACGDCTGDLVFNLKRGRKICPRCEGMR